MQDNMYKNTQFTEYVLLHSIPSITLTWNIHVPRMPIVTVTKNMCWTSWSTKKH